MNEQQKKMKRIIEAAQDLLDALDKRENFGEWITDETEELRDALANHLVTDEQRSGLVPEFYDKLDAAERHGRRGRG